METRKWEQCNPTHAVISRKCKEIYILGEPYKTGLVIHSGSYE